MGTKNMENHAAYCVIWQISTFRHSDQGIGTSATLQTRTSAVAPLMPYIGASNLCPRGVQALHRASWDRNALDEPFLDFSAQNFILTMWLGRPFLSLSLLSAKTQGFALFWGRETISGLSCLGMIALDF